MSDVNYKIPFFSWCRDGNSDKIWGWVDIENKLYNYWGRRGGKLSFKRHTHVYDLHKLSRQKLNKGYQQVQQNDIEKVYPDFNSEFQKQLFTARLIGNVKSENF